MPGLQTRLNRVLNFFGFNREREYVGYMGENETGYRTRREAIDEFYSVYMRPAAIEYPMTAPYYREVAMKIYGRAGRPRLGFLVLGSNINRFDDVNESTPVFPYIDRGVRKNFGRMSTGRRPLGSVLESSHWTFYMNDMLILGGVANRVPFYLASRRELRSLWNFDENRPTAFARELAGLFAAGYHILQLDDGSEAIVPPYGPIPIRFSLRKYIDAIPALMRRTSITAMAQSNLRTMRFTPRNRDVAAIFQTP